MFTEQVGDGSIERSAIEIDAPPPTRILPIGIIAARLSKALDQGDVIFVAEDEQRAQAVAAALSLAAPDATVLHCPSSDALPGDDAPASPANVGRRVAAFRQARLELLRDDRRAIALITTAEAAARLYAAPEAFETAPPLLTTGQQIDLEAFGQILEDIGYVTDDRVDEPGEVAVRGQVIDIFPADSNSPARLEIADGTIAAISSYDPASQRRTADLERLEIGRVSEPTPGEGAVTIFDHLPGAAICIDPKAESRRDRFVVLANDAVRARPGRKGMVADAARWDAATAGRREISAAAGEEGDVPRFVEGKAPFRSLVRFVTAALKDQAVVIVGSARDLRYLGRRLAKAVGRTPDAVGSWRKALQAPPGTLLSLEMPVDRGWSQAGLVVIAAGDLLGSRARLVQQAATGSNPLTAVRGAFGIGDVIIHEEFGIGIVRGLEPLPEGGSDGGDSVVLEYHGGARRLVPVADADKIWRYGSDPEAVTLDRLDGSSWQKRRAEIDAAIARSARELSELATERATRSAAMLQPDEAAYERFASSFAFTETADQARAISDIRADLASGKPMDRLVVGDVGYGKTEVAMRAAALAALSGKQVAIAAPTTVLVRQHLESFRRRFEGTGVEVASLSRLSTPAEKKAVKAGLAAGSIAIVIGTAAVAGKDVRYAGLDLVIIDEEQRFGAADKAKLRELSSDCHILTLTATPIPRTLQTALVGLQQLSIIATPPARRQPIRTSLGAFDPVLLRTALMRERSRGGQSFVVVSRIEDMAPMAEKLAGIVPDLRLYQAHGKMKAAEIDEAMVSFADGDGDILLATNIIEAGLDVPRANTMIVWRADRFGLSQLHQLRGRVGRGGRRGQVLLLTDPASPVAEATLKRLRTLQAFDQLGAGFAISAEDLDMRGAGDLLGDEQAGHVKLIGTDLYQHLLTSALKAARGEAVDRWSPEIHLGVSGRLPESWIPEEDTRIGLYGRLSRIDDIEALESFSEELEDRFGALPEDVETLLTAARIRLFARSAGIVRIDAGPAAIAFTPRPGSSLLDGIEGLVEKGGRYLLNERIDAATARADRALQLLVECSTD